MILDASLDAQPKAVPVRPAAGRLPIALLESWMRDYYFAVEIDIGSSGVEDYSMAELRRLLDVSVEDLDAIVFHDSQTLGGSALRQAIAARWGGGDDSRVMATHGSSEANFLLMNALLEAGDEVVVTDPCYPQLHLIAEAKGCHLRRWPLRIDRGFRPDVEEALALIGPRTRMIVLNLPQNPTGASITPEEQRVLIDRAAEVGAYLVWDNAFGDITYGVPPLPDPTQLYDRALLMGTLSKCYGLPGLRVGWCVAAPEVLAEMIRLRDYVTLHLSPLVELLAARAIARSEVLIGPRREQAQRNREVVCDWLASRPHQVRWAPPQGGVTFFPELLGIADVEAFCHRLAREEKVMLVPGACFGSPSHVRLGFGGPTAALREGLARLGNLLDRVRREA